MRDLQAQNISPKRIQPFTQALHTVEEQEDHDDEEMDDGLDVAEEVSSTPVANTIRHNNSGISLPSLSQITSAATTSPSVLSNGIGRQNSISSASQPSFSPYVHSSQASPAFGPQLHQLTTSSAYTSSSGFGIGSPALKPAEQLRQIAEGSSDWSEERSGSRDGRTEHELDQEATAALLMLNNDRRQWPTVKHRQQDERRSGAAMSVRDLLSG